MIGDRLISCLKSIKTLDIVYVDSGSTDMSLQLAADLGAYVIQFGLDRAVHCCSAKE